MEKSERSDQGFSTLELMTVVLIIGILVAVAIPLYVSVTARAEQRACFQNQETLERIVVVYLGTDLTRSMMDLAGIVDAANPVVVEHIVGRAPRCPSAPAPADRSNPTSAEGAYSFDASGNILPCTHGALGPHGHF